MNRLFLAGVLPIVLVALWTGCSATSPQTKTKEAGFEHLLEQARSGDVSAQYQVATRYGNGVGVDHNDAMAEQWYRAAAQNGHPEAIKKVTTFETVPHP